MLLKQVELSNFRQYENLDITFRDGITGIVGPNGAGKSTILEAILWCLFGTRAARTSKEGIKRQTAGEAEDCRVSLTFEISGMEYTLDRKLIGKSSRSEARLKKEGSLDAVSTREVDSYVVRLIGLDLKGFLSSFFARQRELNALTDSRPAERRDHLAGMLGVGRLDIAVRLLKEDIKEVRMNIDILSGLQIDPDEVNRQLVDRKSEIGDLKRTYGDKKTAVAELDGLRKIRQQEVEESRKKEQLFNRTEKELSILATRKKSGEQGLIRVKKELADIETLIPRLEKLNEKTAGIEQIRAEINELKRAETLDSEKRRLEAERQRLLENAQIRNLEKKELEKQIGDLSRELEEKEKSARNFAAKEAELEKLRTEYRESGSELKVISSDLARLEKQKDEIRDLGPEAVCEFCLRPFGEELPEIEKHFQQEILSLQNRRKPYQKRLAEIDRSGNELKKELEYLKTEMDRLNEKERILAVQKSSLGAIVSSLEENNRAVGRLENRLGEIGEVRFDPDRLAGLEKALNEKRQFREEYIRLTERAGRKASLGKERETASKELAIVENEIQQLSAEMAAIDFDADEYKKVQDELSRVQEKAALLRIDMERLEGKMALLESESRALIDQLERHEKSKKEMSVLRERLTLLEKLSLLFADFRKYLIGRIRPALSRTTSQLFYEMTEGRYQDVDLDEDYNLRLYDAGEDFEITRFSGGEIDLANLCFRLAISIEMARTAGIDRSFIILDEIFGSQDRRRQQLIIEGLNRLKDRFQQIIIISHIEEVKNMTDYTVEVSRDESGISRAEPAGRS